MEYTLTLTMIARVSARKGWKYWETKKSKRKRRFCCRNAQTTMLSTTNNIFVRLYVTRRALIPGSPYIQQIFALSLCTFFDIFSLSFLFCCCAS